MSAVPAQLTFDGREVSVDVVAQAPRPDRPLSNVQRDILRHIGEHGSIRSVEAGIYVHRDRPHGCSGSGGGIGCCRYASADGLEALKRLMKRGLVARGSVPGTWRSP